MPTVRIEQIDDAIVLHFESERERVNAYTLASTLVSIADAAKAANASLNPGYDIEVVVEGIGPGSFRAKLKAVYAKARNLFSDQRVQAIVLGIVANYIYDRTLAPGENVQVEVLTTEVIITQGDDRVVVPRVVYDATRTVEANPEFRRGVSRAIEAVANDDQVTGFAVVPALDSPKPEVLLSREELQRVAIVQADDPQARTITEQCELQIIKAILENSRRKWEFAWRGVRIAAPVLDVRFYERFAAHTITIAPGDGLSVRLAITQSRNPQTGVYTNESYEVVEVFDHLPGMRQLPLASGRQP